jgi:GDPmannose 4,6-dehydratase
MKQKRALISGITGQDGSYLAEILLARGYHVMGLTRDVSRTFTSNIRHLHGKIELHYTPYSAHSIIETVRSLAPDEIYNLTGQTYVGKSWDLIQETVHTTGTIPIMFLEAILKVNRGIRFFQASSSEIFTPRSNEILTEDSEIDPSNPYGCSKAFAHQMVATFRKAHQMFLVNGILFNHESPRRFHDFLSKKVVCAAVAIKLGKQKELVLGNLNAARDWGFAGDYMEAAYLMMQMAEPRDLIIATGKHHTVEELVQVVFSELGMDWQKHVRIDPALFRPQETPLIYGSSAKLRELTGWQPKTSFEQTLKMMVSDELAVQGAHAV